MDAAIELWSETGWRGTGITAVAERAGITPAGLLHHFGTKDEFLLAVVAEVDRQTLERFASTPPTGLAALRLLPDLVHPPAERPALWRLHLMLQAENFDAGSPAYSYYVNRQRGLHRLLADAVEAGQRDGEIRTEVDPDVVAAEILAFLLGLQLLREHGPHELDLVDVCESFADRLVRDLAR